MLAKIYSKQEIYRVWGTHYTIDGESARGFEACLLYIYRPRGGIVEL
jgi:hypothetical protein